MKDSMKAKSDTEAAKTRSGRSIFDDDSFRVKATPSGQVKYDIYVFGVIEDSSQFIDAIQCMDDANEGDLVVVHLSTDGGSIDATDSFVTSMMNCAGRVVVRASGGVHSAGTIILLAAPEIHLSPGVNMLIHNGAMGGYSKTSDIKAQMAFSSKMMDKLAHETYEGFMTEEEIDAMIAGKDFWMDAEEFTRRLDLRAELAGDANPSCECENCKVLDNAEE